jgi:hypothetical protein
MAARRPAVFLLVVDEKHVDHLEDPRENVHVDGLGHGVSVFGGVDAVQILGDGLAWAVEKVKDDEQFAQHYIAGSVHSA